MITIKEKAVYQIQTAFGMLVADAKFELSDVVLESAVTSINMPKALLEVVTLIKTTGMDVQMSDEHFRFLIYLMERLLFWLATEKGFPTDVFKKPFDERVVLVPEFSGEVMQKVFGEMEREYVQEVFKQLYSKWVMIEFSEKGGKFDA